MSEHDPNTQAITDILAVYIARIPSPVLEVMARAQKIGEKMALERNADGQIEAHRVLAEAVGAAVEGMASFDKDLIVEVITTHSGRLAAPKWDSSKALLQNLAA